MRTGALRAAALLLGLGAAGGCAPVDALRFSFQNGCDRDVNLDMKYQDDLAHEARVWNNAVVARGSTIDKEVMVARLETFVVTYWVWYDEYEYMGESLYQTPPEGLEEISVAYLGEDGEGPCRFVEQSR
jgi:hypothetical protein